jgi:Protein of unknown function (DUF3987)
LAARERFSKQLKSLALPREVSEVSEFNDLPKGLGESCPTGIQGVLGTAPKPSGTGDGSDTWPVMGRDSYFGLVGEVVRAIEPHTEADPIAILIQYLAFFGNAVGRGPHFRVEGDCHFTVLNAVLVGQTAKSRKGTSAGRVREIFKIADQEWESRRIKSGLSSGEGLINEVRDPVEKEGENGPELVDAGVDDKRLMILEAEFAGALTVMRRHGNILSRVVRDAWDGRDLAVLVKNKPTRASGAHISIVGHITADELRASLDRTSMANGYANRFLFACVRRARLLPHGGDLGSEALSYLATRTQEAIQGAKAISLVMMTAAARAAWERVYETLSEGQPGLLGAIVGRAEAQTIRLALLYALLDGKDEIDVEHLQAALAVWQYCEASARHVFGGTLGGSVAEIILAAMRQAGEDGMTRTQIRDLFGRHRKSAEIDAALASLVAIGKANCITGDVTGGRRAEVWMIEGA